MSKVEKVFGSAIVLVAIGCISWVAVKDHVDEEQTAAINKVVLKVDDHEKIINGKMPITDFQVKQITDAVNKFGSQIIQNDSVNKKEIRHLQHTVIDILDMTAAMYESKTGKKYKSRWDD